MIKRMSDGTVFGSITGTRVSNQMLLERHGQIIGRAVIRRFSERPPENDDDDGSETTIYEIFDRQGISYGKVPALNGWSAMLPATVDRVPDLFKQPTARGTMLTYIEQKRDLAAFNIRYRRSALRTMIRDAKVNGEQPNPALFQAIWGAYRAAQTEFRRYAARAIEQEAADIAATAGAVAFSGALDAVFGKSL